MTAAAPTTTNLTVAERFAAGKALRGALPRSAHARWKPAEDRHDPVAVLKKSGEGRVPELLPIRYGRMLPSPFAFLRGSAAVMAGDLAATPATHVRVQLCGDCHLMNFGGFGTPERHFVFDLTDFDESLPGPWEWDVKRLAASVVVAGRSIGLTERGCKDAALAAVREYRERTAEFARMHALDLWYARIDGQALLALNGRVPRTARAGVPKPDHFLEKMTETVDGKLRFRDAKPLLYHSPHGAHFEQEMRRFLGHYRETLQEDRRTLLGRYHMTDVAMKVVGVGSVGTRCAVLLMTADHGDALILQYKEAGASVLEPFAGKSRYHSHAQRVVCGQRLLQSASDLFLGWAGDEEKRDFYFRQLRDMKTSVKLEGMTASAFAKYAGLCGWALARAHAKAGDPATVSGYLGRGDAFDRAVASFAVSYADQTERDHAAMSAAVKDGRLVAQTDVRE
jgi:uncharacterized protein (DUF2252 family)